MTLPRLVLATDDVRDIARVLRGALRLRTEIVQLATPPASSGEHMLEIAVPGEGLVTLLVEPAGPPRAGGYPMRVRPVTRVQMAELFELVERLDAPSDTIPPGPPSTTGDLGADSNPEFTLYDDLGLGPGTTTMGGFGVLESIIPAPPSSVPVPSSRPVPSSKPRPQSRPGDPRIGRLLAGKYRYDAPIGSGAAATVYRATHIELRRAVAVKVLHAQNQSDPQFVKRFKAEARTACKLEHTNVTRIIDFGQDADGELYLVMELVDGRPLETIVATEGPLAQRRVVEIGIQVCRALVFAHERGVIHRDIKPENVMIVADTNDDGDPCDLVKVCDFGLAKLHDPDSESADLTVVGMLCGSPAYMSPEQTRGDPLDARTDVYALGVTLFEALTAALPYEAFSLAELFLKKATTRPRRPSTIVRGIDPILEDVVLRAMAPHPDSRHSSARELRSELRAVLDQLDVGVPSVRSLVGD